MGKSSTSFKPGQSGNPAGRRRMPPRLKEICPLSSEELNLTISMHLRMNLEKLRNVMADPNTIALDLMIASSIMKAIEDGELAKAETLFLRSLGRVRDMIDIPRPEPVIIHRISGAQIELTTQTAERIDEISIG